MSVLASFRRALRRGPLFGSFLAATAWAGFVASAPLGAQQPAPPARAGGSATAGAAQSTDVISILAVVNGQTIDREQLSNECLARYGIEALEGLVNRQLIFNETQRLGIVITDQDIEQEIETTAAKFNLPKDRYLKVLADERNIELDRYRQMIWMELSLRQIASRDITVTREEIDRMLEAEIGPKVQVRMISLLDRGQADEVLALAKANPEDFGRLAKEYSKDRNFAAVMGLVPPIRKHVGDPTLEGIAFAMKPGEISDVIEIANQFLILKCEQQIPGFDITPEIRQQAEAKIVEHLTQEKMNESADRLLKELTTRVDIVNVYSDPQLAQQMPGVAAVVDGAQIGMRQLAEECITRYGVDVLRGEINRMLLMQQLQARKLEVSQQDLQEEIERAALAENFVKPDGTADIDTWLAQILEVEGATIDLYVRDAVWPSVALKKLVSEGITVTDEDLQKGFEANYGPRVEVLAIVMQNQRVAHRVWQMATENPSDEAFGQLASQYSEEPASKANYGRVPPIARFGGRPQLEDESFRMQPGEISGLINVGSNWIILKCLGQTQPVVQQLDDVREELTSYIREQKLRLAMENEFQQIMAAAQIDNFLEGTTQAPSGARAARGQANLPFAPTNR